MISTIDYPVTPYIVKNWENNIGVAAGWNAGMRRAIKDGHRYALISNDDVVFESGTVRRCIEHLSENDVTIVSPNFCVPERDGSNMYFDRNLGVIESIHWSCVFVDMYKLIENCGWFDENFYPAYFEDNDMFYRMHLTGQRHHLITDVGFYHKQSATCVTIITQDNWDHCKSYYEYKWGGPPGEEVFDHPYNDHTKQPDYWRRNGK